MAATPGAPSSCIIRLNVGGHRFETTRETLLSVPDSYFSALLSERIPSSKDADGAYFIDRDGQFFAPLLTFLRTGDLALTRGMTKADLLREAKFFLVDSLIHRILEDGQPIFRNRSALKYLEEHGETINALISNSASMGETDCPVLVGVLKDSTPTSTSRLPHWYHRKGAGSILIVGCDGSKQAVDEVKLWFYEQGYGVGTEGWDDFDFYLYFGPFPRGYSDKYVYAGSPGSDLHQAAQHP